MHLTIARHCLALSITCKLKPYDYSDTYTHTQRDELIGHVGLRNLYNLKVIEGQSLVPCILDGGSFSLHCIIVSTPFYTFPPIVPSTIKMIVSYKKAIKNGSLDINHWICV